jgi:hypothetical protein
MEVGPERNPTPTVYPNISGPILGTFYLLRIITPVRPKLLFPSMVLSFDLEEIPTTLAM